MTKETIADIVAEKRARANEIEGAAGRDANQFQRELIADLRAEADRIEAAAKRLLSKSTENDNNENVIISDGNNAALREALVAAQGLLGCIDFDADSILDDIAAPVVAKIGQALAKPPRNCDRFSSVNEAAIAFAAEVKDKPHPCPDFTFSAWLLAPATEQKGDNR